MSRYTPRKQVAVKLTELEAEAVLEACDAFQESSRSLNGSLNANISRAMRKIGLALVRTGGARVRR